MHRSMSNKSSDDKGKVNWKRKPFISGHDNIRVSSPSVSFYKIFLLLIAIHTSIFLIPKNPGASVILLLTLIRGWMNGI